MSFRVRVLLLIVALVATSTTATAWLTQRQAAREISDSVTTGNRDAELTASDLTEYGMVHGTWEGVQGTIRDIAAQRHLRVRLTTSDGALVADSDLQSGRPARPVNSSAIAIDPRPTLPDLGSPTPDTRYREAVATLAAYRRGWRLASCLANAGIGVTLQTGAPPVFTPGPGSQEQLQSCQAKADGARNDIGPLVSYGRECAQKADQMGCLRELFTQQITGSAAPQLRLYLVADQPSPAISTGSITLAATTVFLAAALCAWLLTRRVLRPIGALTAASRRLGARDLSERVPVTGHDELAALGREFNRMAESLERSELRQRQLVADVAHELRTPLANLRGYLEALHDGVLPPSRQLFASLHEEALLHQRIVDDLQDLALAEAGSLAYHLERVELNDIAEGCLLAHGALAEAAGVDLRLERGPSLQVIADPDRLRQALGNLIRNALTATSAGGSAVISVQRRERCAAVCVSDTGRGIAESDLPHVFDRLWRADPARRRPGSGLGLAIARQIVVDHSGTIEVRSRLDHGSSFTICLPVANGYSADDDSAYPSPSTATSTATPTRSTTSTPTGTGPAGSTTPSTPSTPSPTSSTPGPQEAGR